MRYSLRLDKVQSHRRTKHFFEAGKPRENPPYKNLHHGRAQRLQKNGETLAIKKAPKFGAFAFYHIIRQFYIYMRS